MAEADCGRTNFAGGRLARRLTGLALACAALTGAAAPALAREFRDSGGMKEMTILQCTGQGRWARGPMEALETYAIDTAGNDILVYDRQASSFHSICDAGGDCSVGIDGATYSVSRQDGPTSYALAISRATGGWSEEARNATDKTDFNLKSGACKAAKNPLGKAPKPKF